ncbi:unnamed protein product [Sphagnum balticum]
MHGRNGNLGCAPDLSLRGQIRKSASAWHAFIDDTCVCAGVGSESWWTRCDVDGDRKVILACCIEVQGHAAAYSILI